MTETEARALILDAGYEIQAERDRYVRVAARAGQRGCRNRTFEGVNWRDLASHFRLHERSARSKS